MKKLRGALRRAVVIKCVALERPGVGFIVAGDDARKLLVLIDALEELDDVQNVYSNADLPDDEE